MTNRILFIFLFFFCNYYSFSQKINLPDGYNEEVEFSRNFTTPIFSIYINKNKDVFLEDKKVDIKQLGDTIFKYRNFIKPENMISIINQVYADKNLPYKYIEEIKTQISISSNYRLMYRTDNIEAIEKGFFVRLGKTNYPRIKKSVEKDENSITLNFSELKIAQHPIEELEDELYAFNFEKVKALKKKFNYKKINFLKNGKIKIDNKKYCYKDISEVYNQIKETDFFFLNTSPKTKYKDYLRNLIFLSKSLKKNKKRFVMIEISDLLKKKMIEQNFNILD